MRACSYALARAPLALRRRAIRRWLTALCDPPYAPDAASVERVLEVASGAVLACEVHGGLRIRRSHGRLVPEPDRTEPGGTEPGGTKTVR